MTWSPSCLVLAWHWTVRPGRKVGTQEEVPKSHKLKGSHFPVPRRRHCPLRCTDLNQRELSVTFLKRKSQVRGELPRDGAEEARGSARIHPPLPPRAPLFSRLGSLFKCKHQEAPLPCGPELGKRLTSSCWLVRLS